MIHLYSSSGSGEVQLVQPVASFQEWSDLRSKVARFMRARKQDKAAEILERTPFMIMAGTNSFTDDFELLYLAVSPEEYARYEEAEEPRSERILFRQIADALNTVGPYYIRFIVVDMDFADHPAVRNPTPQVTSETVTAALADAEQLLLSRGPQNAVDRVHTALHAYLQVLCTRGKLTVHPNDSLTVLFKTLRAEHPKLAQVSADPNVSRIFGALASIVDALNTIRNHHTLVHPNEKLLGQPEAMLVINATRSLLAFIDEKLTE